MTNRLFRWLAVGGALFVAACGGTGDEPEDVGEMSEALVPGTNAAFVSASPNFQNPFQPGERRQVQIIMRNTGTDPATNTWTTSFPKYALYTKDSNWHWAATTVSAAVPINTDTAFTFIVTAPGTPPPPRPFSFQMRADTEFFGPITTLTPAPVIDPGAVPEYGCTYVSGVPATLAPDETRQVTLVVRNTGTATWTPASNFAMVPKDTPVNLWNYTGNAFISSTVTPGNTGSVTFTIRAPSTPGVTLFSRGMKSFALGPGDFRAFGHCIEQNVIVGGSPTANSVVDAATFASPVTADSIGNLATITMRNTGTEPWIPGTFVLTSMVTPSNFWGLTQVPLPVTVDPGSSYTFNFGFRAPSTAGTFPHSWMMRKLTGTNVGLFGGAATGSTVVVQGTANYVATVVSQVIPPIMTIGKPYTFTITMQNTGASAWSGDRFGLWSVNSPVNLWSTDRQQLGSSETVSPTGTRVFNLAVTPLGAPGTYSSRWQMRSFDVGYFDAVAVTNNIIVTLCGNNVIDPGETCDDDNVTDGDSCSSTCQDEQQVYDAAGPTSRALVGSGNLQQAGVVVLGDVTGDGIPEVFTSESTPVGFGTNRAAAGVVFGRPGGAGFLNGTVTTNPTGATVTIGGAEKDDGLGTNGPHRIIVAEVTGDTIKDLVLAAHNGDGPNNGCFDCGEVFIFTGGSALMNAGIVDMANPVNLPPRARITGPLPGGHVTTLAVGDLTGDGQADLLLGSSEAAGTAGRMYIVGPAAALTGEVDMAAPPAGISVIPITGEITGDRLGIVATIGDLNGDGINDLLAGAPLALRGGKTRAGVAYAKFGPITSGLSFTSPVGSATGASAHWVGRNATDGLGGTVAIGNVTGTATAEALIGGIQYQRGGSGPQGGGVHIWSDVTSGTTYDEVTATPTAMITGATQGDNCGTSLALGDINADGTLDIFFGCSAASTLGRTQNGNMQVVFGAATLPANYDLATVKSRLILHGDATASLLGRSLPTLSVADIDGDGAADFCAGAVNGGGATKPGRVNCVASPF